ncbi:hypothetical protein AB5I41_09515 [Sphingomonas sp. MMS24-JH45]
MATLGPVNAGSGALRVRANDIALDGAVAATAVTLAANAGVAQVSLGAGRRRASPCRKRSSTGSRRRR